MDITCPHCNFAKTVDPAKVPDRPVKVNCPKCKQAFSFDKTSAAVDSSVAGPSPVVEPGSETPPRAEAPAAPHSGRRIICNACGTVQAPAAQCSACGATIVTTCSDVVEHEYAGFWIRVAATLLDGVILLGIVGLMVLLLWATSDISLNPNGPMYDVYEQVLKLFVFAISTVYYVFFTGYCGQTPGKMGLRIKVIKTDGSPLGYARSFLREVVGKYVSQIILMIGFIMVAFDGKKQGLHDKIAHTYVIKL